MLVCAKHTEGKLTLNSSAEIVFVTYSWTMNLLLFALARRWPRLLAEWHRAEAIFCRPPYTHHRPGRRGRVATLRWRLRAVAFGMLLAAAVEHALYIGAALLKNGVQIRRCQLRVEFFENLFRTERAHMFAFVPYSHWLAAPAEYCNVALTFCWTFADVFVALVSVALAERLAQFNGRLAAARGKPMVEQFWASMRADHTRLAELVRLVDRHVSTVVMMSCLCNMYFVCFLLYNSFK